MRKPSEKMNTFAQLWDVVPSLYMPGNHVRANFGMWSQLHVHPKSYW